MLQEFSNLLELVETLKDEETCIQYLQKQFWKDGRSCPHCGCEKTYALKDGKRFKCSNWMCDEQFTVKVGTIFHGSKVPLKKWFIAIYLLTSHKKGVSSHQLARDIKVTQKTAWFMLHRIRHAYSNVNHTEQLGGDKVIEIDETYVGGKNKNRHWDKKVKKSQGRSAKDKVPVVGILEREGQLRAFVVANTGSKVLEPLIVNTVKRNSRIMTDEWWGYKRLHLAYDHNFIRHGNGQYVDGDIYTNTMEGVWSHLKRSIFGVYHSASSRHLQRYVDESVFRYNTRKVGDGARVAMVIDLANCRLKYNDLIGKNDKEKQSKSA